MSNLSLLFQNAWFRVLTFFSAVVFSLFLFSFGFNLLVVEPVMLDIRDAKRGVSRFQGEISSLERQVKAIEKKIEEKSKVSQGRYQHYYNLYLNPVRYINQFVLNQAKPEPLLITSSSVMPNTSLTSIERTKMKPYLKEYGISRVKNLTKTFSITRVSLTAVGSFPMVGLYLSNLSELPVKFSIRNFELRESNNALVLSLELAFIVYRMPDEDQK